MDKEIDAGKYKECDKCGMMKMVGTFCTDPTTGVCDKDERYVKEKKVFIRRHD